MNLINKNPEWVLETLQLDEVKRAHGCAACARRDKSVQVFGRGVCGIEGRYPHRGGFCDDWQYDDDEGMSDGG